MPRVGDYELEAEIGRGGMGRVVRARHLPTGALRAVKLLDGMHPDALARFEREAEALARVGPSVAVPVHERGQASGQTWFAMDLMPGGSLADRIKARGATPWREAVSLVGRLARAIERCHAAGLVHRDLKPANVLFDAAGEPRLADFGCSRDLDAATLTEAGATLGTPAYMAPEQVNGERGDERCDVYALAVTLHELLTGALPHSGKTWHDLLDSKTRTPSPPVASRVGAPRLLDRVLARALDPTPARRTPDAGRFAGELEALATAPDDRPRRALVGGVLASVALVGTLALVASRRGPPPGPTLASPTPSPAVRATPSPEPTVDPLRREELLRGHAREGELAGLGATRDGRTLLRGLAHDAVVFPVGVVRSSRREPSATGKDLGVLEDVALLWSGDATERRAAVERLGVCEHELPRRLGAICARVDDVRRVYDEKRKETFARPFPGGELDALETLAARPELIAAAVAPLDSACRFDLVASPAGAALRVLARTLSVPVFETTLDALPIGVAAEFLTVAAQWKGDHADGKRARDTLAPAIARTAARCEADGDRLLAFHLRGRNVAVDAAWERAFEEDRARFESLRSSLLADGGLTDVEVAFVAVRSQEVSRLAVFQLEKRIAHPFDHGHAGLELGISPDAFPEVVEAARLALERALDLRRRYPASKVEDPTPDCAHHLTALLLASGRLDEARAISALDDRDPIRALLAPDCTVESIAAAADRARGQRHAGATVKAFAGVVARIREAEAAGHEPDLVSEVDDEGWVEWLAAVRRLGR